MQFFLSGQTLFGKGRKQRLHVSDRFPYLRVLDRLPLIYYIHLTSPLSPRLKEFVRFKQVNFLLKPLKLCNSGRRKNSPSLMLKSTISDKRK